MLDSKSYVIGIIEIDPMEECEQTWPQLAGDDETLDAVLSERVVANLSELSSDLAERLAEIRQRLAAAALH